jgi:signal transduction histidine kinase
MGSYLSTGEQLKFYHADTGIYYEVKKSSPEYNLLQPNSLHFLLNKISDRVIKLVLPSGGAQQSIDLSNGNSIQLSGDASIVFDGWREAAQKIIAFSFILIILLILIILVFYFKVLLPLNHVRRNTLYMKEKFSDAKDFKIPYAIKNKHDEVGVLWESIFDLHKSITSYGRKAQERVERESAILSAIGHEIRSPLQDLMLRHKEAHDPSTRSVHRISAAIKTLTHIYTGTKIDQKKGPQDAINALSGNLTVEDVSEYLRNAADSGIEGVQYQSENLPLEVCVDADLLEFALTNILSNANDFRFKGTKINITTYSDHSYVLIRIANQGPKIEIEPIEQIFEYGVSSRISESKKGHQGLGLFLAKNYIEKINGELNVKNMDDGVLFEIKLIRSNE